MLEKPRSLQAVGAAANRDGSRSAELHAALGLNGILCSHASPWKLPRSAPHLARANADPLVTGQFLEAHWAARADLVGAYADLGAHAELAPVREAGRGVPIHCRGVHFAQKLLRAPLIPRDDAVGVSWSRMGEGD